MARDYGKEYRDYHSKPEQKKNRAMRNAARRKMVKAGKAHKGDGKDVAHVKALSKGGSNKDGYFVEDRKKNQSYARDSNHKPKNTYDKKG